MKRKISLELFQIFTFLYLSAIDDMTTNQKQLATRSYCAVCMAKIISIYSKQEVKNNRSEARLKNRGQNQAMYKGTKN